MRVGCALLHLPCGWGGGRVAPSIMTPQDTDPASDWRAAPTDRGTRQAGSGSRGSAGHRRIARHARGQAFRPGANASKPVAQAGAHPGYQLHGATTSTESGWARGVEWGGGSRDRANHRRTTHRRVCAEVLCLAPYLAPRRRLSHEALAAEIAHMLHAFRRVGMRAERSRMPRMRTSRAT